MTLIVFNVRITFLCLFSLHTVSPVTSQCTQVRCGPGFTCKKVGPAELCFEDVATDSPTTVTELIPTTSVNSTEGPADNETTTVTGATTTGDIQLTSSDRPPHNTTTTTTQQTVGRINDVCVLGYQLPTEPAGCPWPICKYGVCRTGDLGAYCQCDTGAFGLTCAETCCKACGAHGECRKRLDNVIACECEDRFTGEFCETYMYTPEDACAEDYTQVHVSQRQCGNGTTCVHGICTSNLPGYSGNGSNPNCQCEDNVSGVLCEFTCCIDCGRHGICNYDQETGNQTCVCTDSYSGDRCDSIATTVRAPLEWYIVAGIILGALIAVAVPCIIIMWFMYKRRVILMMRFIHQFKGYEDDDERDWDAFISYKCNTTDETWVISTLFPKLTQMGFNINVHFKDFVPGHTITDGIINAIDHSRRTILVISPNYMKSNFTRFEWEKAQQKMIERKNRIIPILLEDISGCKDTMDTNLKDILESITYIQWPSAETDKAKEKFWKRIQLSMPKKKNTSSESGRLDSHVKSSERLGHENGGMTYVTSPESVNITLNGTRKIPTIPDQAEATEVYNTLNENEMLQPEDLYNTLNEATMDSSNPRFDKFGNNSDKPKCVNTDKTPDIKTEGHPVTYSQSTEIPQSLNSESKHKQNDYLNILNLKVQV